MTIPAIFKSKISAPDLQRLLWLWTAIALTAFGRTFYEIYMPAGGDRDVRNNLIGRDFLNIWMGARAAVEGTVSTLYTIPDYMKDVHKLFGADYPQYNFSYPPHILLFIFALGVLPYFPALFAWSAAGLAALIACLRKSMPERCSWPVLALIASSPASVSNLVSGQNGAFTAAFFLGGFYLCETSPVVAGVLFGLLTIKPHLGILVPLVLLLRRNVKCIVSAGVTSLSLIAVSFALWGVAPWQDYFSNIIPYQASLVGASEAFYHRMMPGPYSDIVALLPENSPMVVFIYGAVAFLAFAGTFRVVEKEGVTPRTVLMLALATLIILPYDFNYDMVAVSGALAIYLAGIVEMPVLAHLAFGLLWALPLAVYEIRLVPAMPACSVIMMSALCYLYFQGRRQSPKAAA
jgi:alpha-1,2-mannosyltransferase